jgi:hypothetical protein
MNVKIEMNVKIGPDRRINVEECPSCGKSHDKVQLVQLVQLTKGAWEYFFYCPHNAKKVTITDKKDTT